MQYPTLHYSKSKVNKAGRVIVEYFYDRPNSTDKKDLKKSLVILSNWRTIHAYPINTFQATLRNKLRKIDSNAIVAQRLSGTKIKTNPINN
ncbi:MAG: hypothetical protein HF982_04125 [Desulfobacteraceae bacterium]|nr:hypothetical protein [Desulfobacteraceae bacterium]MBC2718772.1 hypothetical protein [Desulfobacteraceae bacterium]